MLRSTAKAFVFATGVILATFTFSNSSVAEADGTIPSSERSLLLPSKIWLASYPNVNGGRKARIGYDITEITAVGGKVSAKVGMNGRWRTGCTIRGIPAKGTYDGKVLMLSVVISPGDNLTCPLIFRVERGSNGKFEGRFFYETTGDDRGRVAED